MKMTLANKVRKNNKGLTLIELTVVILVLLSLVAILFVGAKAWKKGSDRAANILNIRNVQQAVRGYQNMYGKEIGDPLVKSDIVGAGKFIEKDPTPPASANTSYEYGDTIPAIGTLYITNADLGKADPNEYFGINTSDW